MARRHQDETAAAIAKAELHYYRTTPEPKDITRSSVRKDRWVFLFSERANLVAVYAIRWGANRVDVDPLNLKAFLNEYGSSH